MRRITRRSAAPGREADRCKALGDRSLLVGSEELQRRERSGVLGRELLGGVHDIDGRLVGRDDLLDHLGERGQ